MASKRKYNEDTEIKKVCQICGKEIFWNGKKIHYSSFLKQKFCSKSCAGKSHKPAGFCFRYGSDHPKWTGGKSGRRSSNHYRWASAVIALAGGKCMNCGATNVELHAHHIRPYKKHKELRYVVENGLALCAPCHWDIHTAINAKAVNTGELPTGHAVDNPVPSQDRKVLEGLTTNGRACRRILKPCLICGHPVSRTFGEYRKNKSGIVFCSKKCMGKNNKKYFRHGSNSDTSAAPERDDIV